MALKPRVLLAQASPFLTHRSWSYLEHLGLGFLEKALADAGFAVEVVDATLDWSGPDRLIAPVLASSPMLVGFSVNRSNLASTAHALVELRRRGFAGHVTLGGDFPTFHFRTLLQQFPEIDSIVLGHGEQTASALARCLRDGAPWETLPGIACRDASGEIRFSKNLDTESFLTRLGLPVHRPRYGIARMITSRGCAYACSFCIVNTFDRYSLASRYVRRSLDEVLAEIDLLVRDHGVHHVWLSDMDFVGRDRTFIEQLCDRLIAWKRNLTFEGDCRLDALDEPLVERLARAGCRSVFMGVESFADRQLGAYRKYGKNFDHRAHVRARVALLNRHGIVPRFGFIMFDKDSTLEELRANHDFLMSTVGYGTLDGLANRLAVLPGTPIERTYLADDRHCWRPEITAQNRLASHLYYAQYRFRDERVAFVYPASLSYRNKFSRLQELFDDRLRSGGAQYGEHSTSLWRLRDEFGPIYGELLDLAGRPDRPKTLPDDLRRRFDDRLVEFCVARGFDRDQVSATIAREDEEPGPPHP